MADSELCARVTARPREDTTKLPRAERQRINKEAHRLAQEFERQERERLTRETVARMSGEVPP
tara:strand:- start:1347 stop:1535 length:189 start_codon:yes stop_codon:yes gene_type:complete